MSYLSISPELFIEVISTYLNTHDLISIYYTGSIKLEDLYTCFINKILKKLQGIFRNNYIKVINFIKNNKVSIFGSFVLESILGENYNGDIDFCCDSHLEKECSDFCQSIGVRDLNKRDRYYENTNTMKLSVIESVMSCMYDIENTKSKKLDFVSLTVNHHQEFILSTDVNI